MTTPKLINISVDIYNKHIKKQTIMTNFKRIFYSLQMMNQMNEYLKKYRHTQLSF